jgi:hypothetical protein
VYVYFDNTDVELRAPFDALKLQAILDQPAMRKGA